MKLHGTGCCIDTGVDSVTEKEVDKFEPGHLTSRCCNITEWIIGGTRVGLRLNNSHRFLSLFPPRREQSERRSRCSIVRRLRDTSRNNKNIAGPCIHFNAAIFSGVGPGALVGVRVYASDSKTECCCAG